MERKALREKIDTAEFATYPKHIKAKTVDEAKKFSLIGDKEAQFLPSISVKGLYKEAIENAMDNGLFFFDKSKQTYYFFHKFDKSIGFNNGKETSWIRVEMSGGVKEKGLASIHGHPTNLETVRGKFPQVK